MVQFQDRTRIDDAGDYYCALGWAFGRGKNGLVEHYEEPVEIFASCAGAAIYRKKMLESVGYFDENHFACRVVHTFNGPRKGKTFTETTDLIVFVKKSGNKYLIYNSLKTEALTGLGVEA